MFRKLAQRVSCISRLKKFELLMNVFKPGPETTIVDIGVADSGYGRRSSWSTENFFEEFYPWPHRITAVGLHDFRVFRSAYSKVRCVTADGRCLPFGDKEFDTAFSNAVLEHVGDKIEQEQFISEACRVARKFFIATPNRLFPIELHTRLPLVHWLPKKGRDAVLYFLGLSRWQHLCLLSPRELRGLFHVPVRIVNLGMTLVALSP